MVCLSALLLAAIGPAALALREVSIARAGYDIFEDIEEFEVSDAVSDAVAAEQIAELAQIRRPALLKIFGGGDQGADSAPAGKEAMGERSARRPGRGPSRMSRAFSVARGKKLEGPREGAEANDETDLEGGDDDDDDDVPVRRQRQHSTERSAPRSAPRSERPPGRPRSSRPAPRPRPPAPRLPPPPPPRPRPRAVAPPRASTPPRASAPRPQPRGAAGKKAVPNGNSGATGTNKPKLGSRGDKVAQSVKEVLERARKAFNMSMTFGFVDESGQLGIAVGDDNRWKGSTTTLSSDTPIPLGSVTKPWTAVQVMQAVQNGSISLDDNISFWVDDFLKALGAESVVKLFGPKAKKATIRDLLAHTTGFEDYNDETMSKRLKSMPKGNDILPIEYLKDLHYEPNEMWDQCRPGKCAKYSGNNYILLGFVLAKLQGKTKWYEMDQMAVIPKHLRKRYKHTYFAKKGPCSKYKPEVAHQYFSEVVGDTRLTQDLWYKSCLNGWTMGNIMTTAKDLATFFYDVFTLAPTGVGFLKKESLKVMLHMKPLVDSWCFGPDGPGSCHYGLGFNDEVMNGFQGKGPEYQFVGHGGANWGSVASPCGYSPRYKFGVCLTYTSNQGLNCDLGESNEDAHSFVQCSVYEAVMKAVGGPKMQCDKWPSPEDKKPCKWIK